MTDDTEIPNEYRIVCNECGADGGTYDFRADHDGPRYCPWCGAEVDSDDVRALPAEDEPTALSWESDHEQ